MTETTWRRSGHRWTPSSVHERKGMPCDSEFSRIFKRTIGRAGLTHSPGPNCDCVQGRRRSPHPQQCSRKARSLRLRGLASVADRSCEHPIRGGPPGPSALDAIASSELRVNRIGTSWSNANAADHSLAIPPGSPIAIMGNSAIIAIRPASVPSYELPVDASSHRAVAG